MRIALDTNIVAYFVGIDNADGDDAKVNKVRTLLPGAEGRAEFIVPGQALGELFNVMVKGGRSRQEARRVIVHFADDYEIVPTARHHYLAAADLAVDHRLQIWDALILTAASDAGCELFLSEDLHEGFVLRGMAIVNPLAEPIHPRLAAILG